LPLTNCCRIVVQLLVFWGIGEWAAKKAKGELPVKRFMPQDDGTNADNFHTDFGDTNADSLSINTWSVEMREMTEKEGLLGRKKRKLKYRCYQCKVGYGIFVILLLGLCFLVGCGLLIRVWM